MPNQKSSNGLSIDDIYTLMYEPEKFSLTLENMSQVYQLTKNLIEIFKLKI